MLTAVAVEGIGIPIAEAIFVGTSHCDQNKNRESLDGRARAIDNRRMHSAAAENEARLSAAGERRTSSRLSARLFGGLYPCLASFVGGNGYYGFRH